MSDKMVVDPVCKMKIPEGNVKVQHKGNTYYFCSSNCQAEFMINPNKFAK